MDIPTSIGEMASNLSKLEREHWASLPDKVKETLEANRAGSSVDLFCKTMEAMWANRAELKNNASKEVLGQLAGFCAMNGFHGLSERGAQIKAAVQRDLGEEPIAGMAWPPESDDPQSDPAYVAAEEVSPAGEE